ncbi:MAG: hypothetical protein GX344_04440 [Intrasporangiaceae bacterium]|mgnify:CR=1 FL=1|nr:hypothetical protein [Intrasporangiaceae bacterium]
MSTSTRNRVAGVLLVLAALAAGRFLDENLPAGGDSLRPYDRHGLVQMAVPTRWADVEAVRVSGAPQVIDRDTLAVSPGLWVVVEVNATPHVDPFTIGWAELRGGDGRTYSRGRGSLLCSATNPGLTAGCVVTIEAAPESLPGSSIALSGNAMDQRADDMAVIDLGITQEVVDHWLTLTDPLEVPLPVTGGQP